LFSLPFWGTGFSMICNGILYPLFGSVKVRIDKEQITFNAWLETWKIRRRSASRTSINKLIYTPQYFTRDSEGDTTVVQAKLEIWAGVEKFEFNLDTLKSEAELEWLAKELSDWLGMGISEVR
jgi:hypothetical protein